MALSREEKARIIRQFKERAADLPEDHHYDTDDGKVTSFSGEVDDEAKSTLEGLVGVLSFAPAIEECIRAGRVQEAIDLFQDAVGTSTEEAEAAVNGLVDKRACEALPGCVFWFSLCCSSSPNCLAHYSLGPCVALPVQRLFAQAFVGRGLPSFASRQVTAVVSRQSVDVRGSGYGCGVGVDPAWRPAAEPHC